MTDGAVHALEEKMNKCIVNWQSAEQHVQKRNAVMPKVLEAANVTLLVLNLSHVPVANMSAELQGLEAEKVKDHKGARVTFMVLKVLSPGWTWVNGTEKENKNSNPKGARGGKAPEPAVTKDNLNAMLGEHVLMHSYSTVQSRGTYTRAARAGEYLLLSPGPYFFFFAVLLLSMCDYVANRHGAIDDGVGPRVPARVQGAGGRRLACVRHWYHADGD